MGDRTTHGPKTRILLCWMAVLSAVLVYTLVMADRSPAHQADDPSSDPASTVAIAGQPLPADASKLSEHNLQWLKTQPPQAQMEFLLGAAINHDQGATDLIRDSIASWRGRLHRSKRWEDLETTALYSNDLRVRAAAIEINLAVNNLSETEETVSRLMENGEKQPAYRPWSAWELGMLANRGTDAERIHERLVTWMHDKDQQTRFWAVEGLAHVGSERTIQDFLDVLRNDPSMAVRERAGCGLAKSGMLTRERRMKAVPGLLELSDDPALNEVTRKWVYQALREITDENLPDDPALWRNWYSTNGAKKIEQFRHNQPWAMLGNS